MLTCPRHTHSISEVECCQTVLATEDPAELAVCLRCEHGQARAATCPFRPLPEAVMAERRTAELLPVLVRHVLERFPKDASHGIGFLARVAVAQYGFEGDADALLRAFRRAGLHTFARGRRAYVAVDDAARSLAASA